MSTFEQRLDALETELVIQRKKADDDDAHKESIEALKTVCKVI